jgi:hypothetical protein
MHFLRRYRLIITLLLVTLGGIALPKASVFERSALAVQPTAVIPKKAVVIDQGVALAWFPARPAAHPIGGYVIERNRQGGGFTRIARAEAVFSEYLDADGRSGDTYRIITEDNQRPARRSKESEPMTAAPARPGSNVVFMPQTEHVLGTSTTVEQASSPDARVILLQNLLSQAYATFDRAVAHNNQEVARGQLMVMQDYQRQILRLWSQLSVGQKTSAAQLCKNNTDIFDANAFLLPEEDQLNIALVQAGCVAIDEGV